MYFLFILLHILLLFFIYVFCFFIFPVFGAKKLREVIGILRNITNILKNVLVKSTQSWKLFQNPILSFIFSFFFFTYCSFFFFIFPVFGTRKLREVIAIVGQLSYRVGGMEITVKGRQASRQEAPILVIAPHSTFLDAVVVYVTGFPSIIARWESGLNPWLGSEYLCSILGYSAFQM